MKVRPSRNAWKSRLAVAVASIAVSWVIVAWLGVRIGGDTTRYVNGAQRLLQGEPLVGKESSYAGYAALMAMSQVAGDMHFLVGVHVLLAAAAAVALYDLGTHLAGGVGGAAASLLFIGNIDISRWHAYLLTDSVYISFVVLTCWTAWRAWHHGGVWNATLAAITAAAAASIRPNGWILLPIVASLVIWRGLDRRSHRIAAVAVVGAAFVLGAAGIRGFRTAIEYEYPGRWLRAGLVVWGFDGWKVNMPPDSARVAGDWVADASYVLRHPMASTTLAAARVAAEAAHVRPFYSRAHNALIVIGLLVIYPAALAGLFRWRSEPLTVLSTAIIASHLLIVSLTFADWDGRFILYVFPLLTLFAGCEALIRVRAWRDASNSS